MDPSGAETRPLRKLLLQILQNSTAMLFQTWRNKYKCFFCSKTFHKASELKDHTKGHIDAEQKANRCKYGLIRVNSVKIDVTELKCKCDREFDTLKNFLTHLNEFHKENVDMEPLVHIESYKLSDNEMKCLICNKSFKYFNQLLLHTYRLHKKTEFVCEFCGVSFCNKANLVIHCNSVHKSTKKIYKCNHCSKKFSTLNHRNNHVKTIHDVSASTCHICKEIFGSSFRKITHMADVHNVREHEFKCEMCPRIYLLPNRLDNHVKRIHLKEKTKVCDVCGDSFFNDHDLRNHKVRHSGEKPYACDLCTKRFPRKKALDLHKRIHTGDKRYVCVECGKAFVQAVSLRQHVRVHQGIGKKQTKTKKTID